MNLLSIAFSLYYETFVVVGMIRTKSFGIIEPHLHVSCCALGTEYGFTLVDFRFPFRLSQDFRFGLFKV